MRTVVGSGSKSGCSTLASLPVQVNAVVAEPVADWCPTYSIMLRYIAPRMTRAVVVIDAIFGRFVDLINGIEFLYFRHGKFSRPSASDTSLQARAPRARAKTDRSFIKFGEPIDRLVG